MFKVFMLEVLSPEGTLYKGSVSKVQLPTSLGVITILAGHAPLFCKVSEGELKITKGEVASFITVTGGFLEVSENKVVILADYAVKSDEITAETVEEGKKKAEREAQSARDEAGKRLADFESKRYLIEMKMLQKVQKRRKNTG